ncbi:MAG: T9SS type A sorting domain-containing protein [Bacteroidetes bacterium]|nr:T9SS type A sorting domain-containing protein [Bacteroidota bacterium]
MAQPEIYLSKSGDPDVVITYDNITKTNWTQADVNTSFSTSAYREIFTNNKKDTLKNLVLGQHYYIQNVHVNGISPIGPYTGLNIYDVVGYALPDLFATNAPEIVNTIPRTSINYLSGIKTVMELYYDTSKKFNSPLFRNLSNTNPSPVYAGLNKHGATYYLKAKSTFKNQVLPEKIIKVTNNFKPVWRFSGYSCGSVSKALFRYTHTYSGVKLTQNKIWIRQGAQVDSFLLTEDFVYYVTLIDSQDMQVISWIQYADGLDTTNLRDTTIVPSLIYKNPPVISAAMVADPDVLRITNYGCAANMQIKCYEDTGRTKLLLDTNIIIPTSAGLDYKLRFNIFKNSVIDYRYTRNIIWSEWYSFSRNEFFPLLDIYINDLQNAAGAPEYKVTNCSVYKGRLLEVQFDTTSGFNSNRLKTIVYKDTQLYYFPSFFVVDQYVRVRHSNGTYKSNWSHPYNRIYRSKNAPAPGCKCEFPYIHFGSANSLSSSGAKRQYLFGNNRSELNQKSTAIYFNDTTPIPIGDSVFVKVRFFSEIDTTDYSGVTACKLDNPFGFCPDPYIIKMYRPPNADSLHIWFINKNPYLKEGNLLITATASKRYSFIKKLHPDSNHVVLKLNQIPPNGMFAIVANCNYISKISQIPIHWLNTSTVLSVHENSDFSESAYFDFDHQILYTSDKVKLCHVFDQAGKLAGVFKSSANGIDLSHLANGTYFIQFLSESANGKMKIIVAK